MLMEEQKIDVIEEKISNYIKIHKRMIPKDKPTNLDKIKNSIFFKPDFLKIKPLINIMRDKEIEITHLNENLYNELYSILENKNDIKLLSYLEKNVKKEKRNLLEAKLKTINLSNFCSETEIDKILSKFQVNYLERDQYEELKSIFTLKKTNKDLMQFVEEHFYEEIQSEIEKALQNLLNLVVNPNQTVSQNQNDSAQINESPFELNENKEITTLKKQFWENFQQFCEKNKPEYDDNISKIRIFKFDPDTSLENLPKIISTEAEKFVIEKIKISKNFFELMENLKPFLYDLLKRKKRFDEVLKNLNIFSEKCPNFKDIETLKNLDIKDILIFMLESSSKLNQMRLGLMIAKLNYPLPFFYPISLDTYSANFEVVYELLMDNEKMLIMSLGFENSFNKGKSYLLSKLFSLDEEILISLNDGYTHFGSIDIFTPTNENTLDYFLADVHGFSNNEKFLLMVKCLMSYSAVVILHLYLEDFNEDGKPLNENLIKTLDYLSKEDQTEIRGNFIVILRDYLEDAEKANKICSFFKDKSKLIGFYKLENLNKIQKKSIKEGKIDDLRNFVSDVMKEKLSGNLLCLPGIEIIKNSITGAQNGSPQISKEIRCQTINYYVETLNEQYKKENFYKTIFPTLTLKTQLWNLNNRKKEMGEEYNRSDYNTEYHTKLNENFSKIQEQEKNIKEQLSKTIQKEEGVFIEALLNLLIVNDVHGILNYEASIVLWKNPIVKPLKEKYMDLQSKIHNLILNEKTNQSLNNNEIKNLKSEMNDINECLEQYDISIDTVVQEIIEKSGGKAESEDPSASVVINIFSKSVMVFLNDKIESASPLSLIDGKSLLFGNSIIEKILSDIDYDDDVFVISIIGAQSSAKSTLLNYLFGCGFATSAGRCTKGLYFTIIKRPADKKRIVVIDTEGLLSIVARNQTFDNQITTMTFAISNLVIINNKGEITSTLQNLLGVCVYALKCLNMTGDRKPKVFFALRDQTTLDKNVQKEMLSTLIQKLQEEGTKNEIKIHEYIDLTQDDVFLLPPAFNKEENNGREVTRTNDLFASYTLYLRGAIEEYFQKSNTKGYTNLKQFYNKASNDWKTICECGVRLMTFQSLHQINRRRLVSEFCDKWLEKFHQKADENYENKRNEFFKANKQEPDDFDLELSREYESLIKEAQTDFITQCEKNETEFGNIDMWKEDLCLQIKKDLNYSYNYHKRAFLFQYNRKILEKKEIEFEHILQSKVNEFLQEYGTLIQDHETQIFEAFELYFQKNLQEFEKVANETVFTSENIQKTLIDRCNLMIDKAKEKMLKNIGNINVNDLNESRPILKKDLDESSLGSFSKLFKSKEEKKIKFDEIIKMMNQKLDELNYSLECYKNKKCNDINENFCNELYNICVNLYNSYKNLEDMRIKEQPFMRVCFLKALNIVLGFIKNQEQKKKQDLIENFQKIFEKIKHRLKELIKSSGDDYQNGKNFAKNLFDSVIEKLTKEFSFKFQNDISTEIRKLYKNPEIMNNFAYSKVFVTSQLDYLECWKYVINLNRYLKELCYSFIDEKMKQLLSTQEGYMIREPITKQFLHIRETLKFFAKEGLKNTDLFVNKLDFGLKEIIPITIMTYDHFAKGFEEGSKGFEEGSKGFDRDRLVENIKKQILAIVEEYVENNVISEITGCQATCPLCNAKCCHSNEKHEQHEAKIHLLTAFGGCRNNETKIPFLINCIEKSSVESCWIHSAISYSTLHEMIATHYESWSDHFPKSGQIERYQKFEDMENIKKVWMNIRLPLIEKLFKYRMIDVFPEGWELFIEDALTKEKLLEEGIWDYDLPFERKR